MIKVRIPSFRRVDDEHDSYTAFCITVTLNGRQYIIERRYTDFEELHKKLKQKVKSTEPFPAKVMLKWSSKVLEHRRQLFEKYLQSLTDDENIPKCVLKFLEVAKNLQISRVESLDQLDSSTLSPPAMMVSQSTIAFAEDAFLHESNRGSLADIITIGTLQGLYGSRNSIDDET